VLRAATARLLSPAPAAQLAALRIVVPAMILVSSELRHARQLAAVPPSLRVAPEGLNWFVARVPIGPNVATVVQSACVIAALCAIVGLAARPALAVLAVTSFYLFALSQLSGAVWHDMHLLWMTALLAASPCDDALAFERLGQPPRADSLRYGLPLFFARLLLACIYFFPGLHKVLTSGLDWALSDNLRNQLWWKWAQYGVTPAIRIDRAPTLLHGAGLFVLGFELSFPVLALTRRGRPWAATLGIAFHILAAYFFRISFVSLWAMYVVLVNPERAVRFARRIARRGTVAADSQTTEDPEPTAGVAWVGALLFAGAFVQGVRGQSSAYPFACYPTFQFRVGTEMPDLMLEIDAPGRPPTLLTHARDAHGRRSQRQWGEIWSLAGASTRVDPTRLRAYVETVTRSGPGRALVHEGANVRCYRAYLSVVPEERAGSARKGPLLAEFSIAGATPTAR
jgi:hypothetical protein